MKPLIQKLVEIPSPSGYESRIRDLVRSEIEPYVDDVRVDALGNLIARKGQSDASALKVMLAAHIDEIGIIITHVDERGFLRFLPIGGVREKVLAAYRLKLKTVILPAQNRKDLVEIPRKAKREMNVRLVRDMDAVLDLALAPSRQRRGKASAQPGGPA